MLSIGNVRILVISQDAIVGSDLAVALRFLGYRASVVTDMKEGKTLLDEDVFDCLLLEEKYWAQGRKDLTQLLEAGLPTLILSQHPVEWREIAALAEGADDYLPMSIGLGVLCARINRSVSRRHKEIGPSPPAGLAIHGETVTMGNRTLSLPRREVKLLEVLMEACDRALSREVLLDRVWGLDALEFELRTVDVAVARLRKKLFERFGVRPIETVPGTGYRYRKDMMKITSESCAQTQGGGTSWRK